MFEILSTGPLLSFQDKGRPGWKRYGVPASGAMDDHAAFWANQLLANAPSAPLLEILWHSTRLRVLNAGWVAITGAGSASIAMWRTVHLKAGESLDFIKPGAGNWTYLAVESGFAAPSLLNSASVYPTGGIGSCLRDGDEISRRRSSSFQLPHGVTARLAPASDHRNYAKPPALRVWPGPQWDLCPEPERSRFFDSTWQISPQSNRVGYRLEGAALKIDCGELISEPVRTGSIQVPPNGQPIITMRDGPTVGGYPKLGLVHPKDISWLAQCKPGQNVRFKLIEDT